VPTLGPRQVREGNKVKSRRERLHIFRSRILLACSIYGRTEGLYRQFNELFQSSPLTEILQDIGPQQRSSRLPSPPYSDPSFVLPSDGFRPCVRIHICSFLLLIDNGGQMKLETADYQDGKRYKGKFPLCRAIAGDFQQSTPIVGPARGKHRCYIRPTMDM